MPDWENELAAGKTVEISGRPEVVKGPLNPGEFDFRNYYRSKGIAVKIYGKTYFGSEGSAYPCPAMLERIKGVIAYRNGTVFRTVIYWL